MTHDAARVVRFAVDDAPGLHVELVGDVARQDGRPWPWDRGLPMREDGAGHYVVDVALAPGVYRCKVRIEPHTPRERWRLVPGARLLDHVEGVENSVVVVDGRPADEGADEDDAFVFAADVCHVQRVGAALTVVAEATTTGRRPGALVVVGASGARQAPLREVARVADRILLRATADVADATGFGFDDDDARWPVPASPSPSSSPPSWLRGAVLYGVFVDRWHRGVGSPPDRRARARPGPSSPSIFYGGDLDGIAEGLPYLRGLGVDAVVLTPVHQSHTPHRYDPIDPLTIDERLGGRAALLRLVERAHDNGLKVVVDAAVTHVNELHAAFQDVLQRQEASPYAPWFRIRRFPVRRRDASTFDHYYRCPELPWLDLRGPAAEHALAALDVLLDCGVDGLRFDAMDDAPDAFWRAARARARAKNADVLLLGEVVGDDLWRRAGEGGCDVVTDFRVRDALLTFAVGLTSPARLVEQLRVAGHRSGAFAPSYRLAFIDNHDTLRALSRFGGDVTALRRALAVLCFLDETIALTAGTEAHLFTPGHNHGQRLAPETPLDDAWGDRLPMPPLAAVDATTTTLLQALLRARRATRDVEVAVDEASDTRLTLRRGPWRVIVDAGAEPRLERVDPT